MAITVEANELTICHVQSGGVIFSDVPNICLTPPNVPVNYVNVGKLGDLFMGTKTVSADGGNSIAHFASKLRVSTGDEGGSLGGVGSGTNLGMTEWTTCSSNVFYEGCGVIRRTDQATMNSGNSAGCAGVQQDEIETAPLNVEREQADKVIPVILLPGIMGSRLVLGDKVWDPEDIAGMIDDWLVEFKSMEAMGTFASEVSEGAELGKTIAGGWGAVIGGAAGAANAVRRNAVSLEDKRLALAREQCTVMDKGKKRSDSENERGWGGVVRDNYVPILRTLDSLSRRGHQCRAFAIGYDWRKDIRRVTGEIAKKIDAILGETGSEHFILITHSMGGLVGRLTLMRNSGLAGKALGVIHLAQPVTGAVLLVRRILVGFERKEDGLGETMTLGAMLGWTGRYFSTLISGAAGVFCLLPTSEYGTDWLMYGSRKELCTHTWEGDVWQIYFHPLSPPGLRRPVGAEDSLAPPVWLDFEQSMMAAMGFREELGLWKHPSTWSIYCDDLRTDTGLYFDVKTGRTGSHSHPRPADYDDIDIDIIQTDTGDGTVPAHSAMALFPDSSHKPEDGDFASARQFRVSRAKHDKICDNAEARRCVEGVILHLLEKV